MDGKFVAIPGLEWSPKWGHTNIYDPETRYWPRAPAEFYMAAAGAGVIVTFNHPKDGKESHSGLRFRSGQPLRNVASKRRWY